MRMAIQQELQHCIATESCPNRISSAPAALRGGRGFFEMKTILTLASSAAVVVAFASSARAAAVAGGSGEPAVATAAAAAVASEESEGSTGCGCGMPSRSDVPGSGGDETCTSASAEGVDAAGGGDGSSNAPVGGGGLAKIARRALAAHPKRDMVALPGSCFYMGSDDGWFPEDGEGPAREVCVDGFSVDVEEVSNARFAEFVAATGYKTEAEGGWWQWREWVGGWVGGWVDGWRAFAKCPRECTYARARVRVGCVCARAP
jgi:formylglycine-generating enzyme required for sulfatase activity